MVKYLFALCVMWVGCDRCCNAACSGRRLEGRGTRGIRNISWIVSSQCYSGMKGRMEEGGRKKAIKDGKKGILH